MEAPAVPITLEHLCDRIKEHEKRSQRRFESLQEMVHSQGAHKMGENVDNVKVENIFKKEHDGMGIGALPALLGGGFGAGSGAAWGLGGLVVGALLGNRRGGLFGGGDGDCGGGAPAVERFIELDKLGRIEGQIATSANETQAVVNAVGANAVQSTLQQTIGLQQTLQALQLANQQSFDVTRAAIVAGATENLVATKNVQCEVERQGWALQRAIDADGDRTRALITRQYEDTLNRQLSDAKNKITELEGDRHRIADNAALTLQITNTNTALASAQQQQQQAQQQQQGFALNSILGILARVEQVATATNQNIIAGNTGAVTTGLQNSTPTNVNTR